MIQEASSMTTSQSFIGVASSSNIKCSFCLCEECEQQHDYFISRVKELTDIFKEMTYNIDVHTSKKISQPLKCRRLKKYISQSLSIISERKKSMTTAPVSHSNPKGKEKEEGEKEQEKEKEKVKKKAKEKEKKKEKKVEVVNCDVKEQYPLVLTLTARFKQLDFVVVFPKKKDWFYVMSQPNKCWTDENKIVGTIKGFGIPGGLPWHLTAEINVPVNCNGEFHWVLPVVVLKERCIKTEPTGQFLNLTKERTNLTHWKSYMLLVLPNKKAIVCKDCELFVVAHAEFLSNGLQVPSYGISSETLRMKELASEAISSSQVEPKFSQKEYEEREKKNEVDDDGERAEEVEEEEGKKEVEEAEGNKKEVEEDKGKQKEEGKNKEVVEEEEGKNKEVVEEEEEKINEVDEDKGKQKEAEEEEGIKNEVEDDDGIKTPNATGDSILRSAMGKSFDSLRTILKANDVNNNIALKLVKFSKDIEAFNNYSYELTIDYLLRPLSPKINNLFGFPWAFIAFEVIPHLRHQVTTEEEISSPRILRWLREKTKIVKNPPNLYNLPHDVVNDSYIATDDLSVATCDTNVATDNSYVATDDPFVATCNTNYIDEILSLTGERHVRYPEYYDSTDRILDLNFYSNFKQRYDKMSEEATTVDGRSFTQLINEFEWNEDMINYVRGIRPYPGGMNWIGAKRILTILLHDGRMNVYDCQLMSMEHAKFFTFIQPMFELLPKLLKQSGIMKHLPNKFLNEPWEFEGQLEPMVTNDTKATWPNAMDLSCWDSIQELGALTMCL
ncbi:hypothetical protein H5410_036658 [Solanum commersonii]|uniref:Ulp1 protease family, C-terminal catalytic domain containing protein n=1 Tax=Solanum commersonii TaxID=4109 RepID=A0A9J5Y5W9_SOLCO|nr:hypothetical protein H5410_036658 [Solanum commersonii]